MVMLGPTWCRASDTVAIDTENNASAGNVAVRAVYLGLFLFGLWFLLSGSYVALLLALGFASSVFVVAIALRMHIVDRETHPIHLHSAIVFYWIWLTWEIVKANIDVARRVLDPRLPMSPNLLRVKATQKTDLGRVSYANSITLTPGDRIRARRGRLDTGPCADQGSCGGASQRRNGPTRDQNRAGPLMSVAGALAAGVVAILVTMTLALIRSFKGPTVYDRILAVNMVSSQTILMLALLGFLMGRPRFLDIALVYVLIAFTGMMAVLKFFGHDNLEPSDRGDDGGVR